MRFRVYKEENQPVSNWSGGKTRELAIYPDGSDYLDRDFIWRLSTASSDREESSFSKLEGFDRILMVLEGDVVLAHGQQRSAHLGEMEQDTFDGGIKTRCFGKLIRDYNLIMAKGCRGSIEVMEAAEEAKTVAFDMDTKGYRSYGLFCLDGYAVVTIGEKTEMIRPDNQLVIDLDPGEDMIPSVMGQGRCILAKIAFEAGDVDFAGEDPDVRSGEGHTTGDGSFASEYGTCLKLFARSNRWSRVLRREGADRFYYDRPLSKAMEKIERRYVTSIVWMIGCLLCLTPAFASVSIGTCAVMICGFTLVHVFLIAPFIYWKVCPKPVRAHIKSTDELNAFEKVHHQEEISKDPHFERLMSKYSSDDENYFTDKDSPLYRLVKKK